MTKVANNNCGFQAALVLHCADTAFQFFDNPVMLAAFHRVWAALPMRAFPKPTADNRRVCQIGT